MLAFLAENGLQSWSALHLESDLGAGAAIGGIGPGLLELTVAGGRFAGQALAGRLGDGAMLILASLVGGAGATLFALAAAPPAALVGLAVAGAGLSVIAPTAFGLAGRAVPPERRGSAISTTGIIGYTGFFIGPAVLGLMSSSFGLRAALLTIAGLIGLVPLMWLAVAAQRSP